MKHSIGDPIQTTNLCNGLQADVFVFCEIDSKSVYAYRIRQPFLTVADGQRDTFEEASKVVSDAVAHYAAHYWFSDGNSLHGRNIPQLNCCCVAETNGHFRFEVVAVNVEHFETGFNSFFSAAQACSDKLKELSDRIDKAAK